MIWFHTEITQQYSTHKNRCKYMGAVIVVKPLHNRNIVSVHFHHFCCTQICDKLSRDLAMLTYIYINVDWDIYTAD